MHTHLDEEQSCKFWWIALIFRELTVFSETLGIKWPKETGKFLLKNTESGHSEVHT
jgi:hypothetical protein